MAPHDGDWPVTPLFASPSSDEHRPSYFLKKREKLQSQRKTESIPGYMGDNIKDSYGVLNQGATTSKLDTAIGNRVRSDIIWQ